jgi:hypothetical protein
LSKRIVAVLVVQLPLLSVAATSTAGQEATQTQTLDAISKIVSGYAQIALSYAAVLGAAATVSMAFVELFKGVLDLRTRFQRRFLDKWLDEADGSRGKVKPELLFLAIGDRKHESVLCGQPLEKMMGQIQAAARTALDNPEEFPELYKFLTTTDFEATKDSTGATERENVPAKAARTDRDTCRAHAKKVRELRAALAAPKSPETTATPDAPSPQAVSDAAAAKGRLANLVSRKLDGFQLRTQYWWERCNQAFSMVVSIAILELALQQWANAVTAAYRPPQLHVVLLGVIGGLLAPFAKDFSQALTRLGTK